MKIKEYTFMKNYFKKYISTFGFIDVLFIACCMLGIIVFYPSVWAMLGLTALTLMDLLYKTFLVDENGD
jgi:hypothetical protein